MLHPPPTPPTHEGAPLSPLSPRTASRFFLSMRRPFAPPTSPRRKESEHPRAAMYSTPEERRAYRTSRAGPSRYLDSRPTIEQIAMGLHVSRTPHLRPIPNLQHRLTISSPPHRSLHTSTPSLLVSSDNTHDTSTSPSQHRTRHSLPPPPSRPSMKKSTTSSSTFTHPQQRLPSTPAQPPPVVISNGTAGSSRPLSSLRARMSKFIPGYRPLSLPSSLGRASSITSSASDSTRPTTPRKIVRFSTSILAIDERSS